jgi:chromosome segregation ATPase
MKILRITRLCILGLILGSGWSQAQTNEEISTKITEFHLKALESAGKLKREVSKDKALKRRYLEEAKRQLDNASVQHAELKNHLTDSQRKATIPYSAAIEKYHAEARKHYDELNAEYDKEKQDIKKTSERAAYFHTAIANAEAEHQRLRKKIL